MNEEKPMRINRYLALRGHATRRGADELVERGLVTINGRKALLGDKVAPGDVVEVLSTRKKKAAKHYVIYNKPRGAATLNAAGETVADSVSIPELRGVHLFPIGRLDAATRGLMLLTDDGRVTDRLLNPDRGALRRYEVAVSSNYSPSLLRALETGLGAKAERTGDASFRLDLSSGAQDIRALCARYRFEAVDVVRTALGPLRLGALPEGRYRILSGRELEEFLGALGLSDASI